jgi:hypothetical protein
VIYDDNDNEKWDTSNFAKNLPAEPIYIYPQNLKLKANFEIQDIQLPPRGKLSE